MAYKSNLGRVKGEKGVTYTPQITIKPDANGINKQYNVPGTKSDENWTLRLSPDYQKHYYDDLANNKDAVNMPEILSIAVQAKADMDFAKGEKTERQAKAEAKPILDKLNHYSKILKEKE